jgi:hypothetical protein
MKKLLSILLSLAMALSLCSIPASASGVTALPINGSSYYGTTEDVLTAHTFTLPPSVGVTDVTIEVDSLTTDHTILVSGNGISTVIQTGDPTEVIFTIPSLKSGTYDLEIAGDAGTPYRIVIDTLTHASNDPDDPTPLTLGTSFSSNLYDGNRTVDYYTFTLTQTSTVDILAGPAAMSHHYTMELGCADWGSSVYTAQTVNDFMHLAPNEELTPGVYTIKIQSDWRPRTEPFETWYSIVVNATPV